MPRTSCARVAPDPKTQPLRSKALVPEMEERKSRKATFQGWDDASPVRPRRLANAGLYWPEEYRDSDRVRCHHCGVEIRDWESGDDPLDQHLKLTRSYVGSGCEFALRQRAHKAWKKMGGERYWMYQHRGERGQYARRGRKEVSRPKYRTCKQAPGWWRPDTRPIVVAAVGRMRKSTMPRASKRKVETRMMGKFACVWKNRVPKTLVDIPVKIPEWVEVPTSPDDGSSVPASSGAVALETMSPVSDAADPMIQDTEAVEPSTASLSIPALLAVTPIAQW